MASQKEKITVQNQQLFIAMVRYATFIKVIPEIVHLAFTLYNFLSETPTSKLLNGNIMEFSSIKSPNPTWSLKMAG